MLGWVGKVVSYYQIVIEIPPHNNELTTERHNRTPAQASKDRHTCRFERRRQAAQHAAMGGGSSARRLRGLLAAVVVSILFFLAATTDAKKGHKPNHHQAAPAAPPAPPYPPPALGCSDATLRQVRARRGEQTAGDDGRSRRLACLTSRPRGE